MIILSPESLLLGKIVGVTMAISGLSLLLKRKEWLAVTKEVITNPTFLNTAALVEFILGLIIVLMHPIWIPCWPVIITILGWLMMIGSALYLLLPHDKFASPLIKKFNKTSWIAIKGAILLIIGLYISIMAFGEFTIDDFRAKSEDLENRLTQHEWVWVETAYTNRENVTPIRTDAFVLTFNKEGSMGSRTDCNQMGGNFEMDKKGGIEFSQIFSTLMYCEGSQENEYQEMLRSSERFYFENDNLVLTFKDNEGKMFFTKSY